MTDRIINMTISKGAIQARKDIMRIIVDLIKRDGFIERKWIEASLGLQSGFGSKFVRKSFDEMIDSYMLKPKDKDNTLFTLTKMFIEDQKINWVH